MMKSWGESSGIPLSFIPTMDIFNIFLRLALNNIKCTERNSKVPRKTFEMSIKNKINERTFNLAKKMTQINFQQAIYSHRSEVHNEPRRKGQSNLMFQRHLQNAKGEEKYSKMLPLTQKRRLKRRCLFLVIAHVCCIINKRRGWNDSQKLRTSSSLQISGSVTLTIIFRQNIKGL